MRTEGFPNIPEDLLLALEKFFPNRLPDHPGVTLSEVNFKQGQQSVVAFLRIQYERQNKNILEAT